MYINIEKDYYMSTDITVGIPTYRRPDLLERAIESVLNSNLKIYLLIYQLIIIKKATKNKKNLEISI